MTAPLNLDAIRARVDAATEGPWEVDADGGVSTESVPEGGQWSRPWSAPVPVVDTEGCGMGNPADAEFIAHAREDVPALLAEVERLRADRDEQGRFLSAVADAVRTTGLSVSEVLSALGVKTERDRLAATVDRVRALLAMDNDPWIHRDNIRAAIEGTDS